MSFITNGGYAVLIVFFLAIFLIMIYLAKQGRTSWIKIRTLPALEALRDAVGRAAEMGRPIIINPSEGSGYQTAFTSLPENAATFIAGNSVLGYISELAAKFDVKMIVPMTFADTIPLTVDTVREGYIRAGKLDVFNPDCVYFVANQDAAMNAYMNTLLSKEHPALFVSFAVSGTSYQQDEIARRAGAIVIGGVSRVSQLGPKVALCDYLLMGDEFYAAGAYVSGEKDRIATIFATDVAKYLFCALLIVGVIAITLGSNVLYNILKA